jgi:hypothetical protein
LLSLEDFLYAGKNTQRQLAELGAAMVYRWQADRPEDARRDRIGPGYMQEMAAGWM